MKTIQTPPLQIGDLLLVTMVSSATDKGLKGPGWLHVRTLKPDGSVCTGIFAPMGSAYGFALLTPLPKFTAHVFLRGPDTGLLAPSEALRALFASKCAAVALS